MPNPDNEPQLPKNQSPITDDRTGLVSRDWYRFFLNLLNKANTGGGSGTVTSVNVSGGTTGLTTSGGPVTTSGTITLAGTLDVDNGGTGATTASGARTNLGAAASGANSDITSMTGVTGGISSPDFIQFDTTATVIDATGRLYYDDDDQFQTLTFQMNGAAIQRVGEELYYRVKLSSAANKGDVLMFTGTLGSSGGLTAAPATGLLPEQANYILGLAHESGITNDWVFVTTFGEVKNIDTTGGAETWAQGDILYYNPLVTGGLTKTKPAVPNAICLVAAVVHVGAANGVLFIRPTYGTVLGDIEGNVNITSPASGNTLIYDAVAGVWENANLTAGTAISVTNGAGSITIANTGVTSAIASTGISVSSATGDVTFTNTAPDQVVSLSAGTGISTSGTYPNFTITNTLPMTYPGAGIPKSTGTAWGTSYSTTGSGNVVLSVSASVSTLTATGLLNFTGTTITNSNFHTTQTSGVMTIGGTSGTGSITFGRSTVNQTTNIQAGATASGSTKTINLGTAGLSGSTTNINIGSAVAGATSTTTLNGTVTLANALAISSGGTGATTAAAARTNLGATTVGGNFFTLANPSAITFTQINADNTVSALDAATFRTAIGAGTGSGTVTSVTGTSPVASSGGTTPAISLSSGYGDTQNPYASKTANFVLAAPNGLAGVPTFRAIVAADIPTLNQNTTGTAANVTGVVAIANGGTGQTTASAAFNALSPVTSTGDLIIGNGANSSTRLPIGANNYVLTSNGTTATWAVATGSGATITNDTSTSTNVYPTFAAATSGSLSTIYTSNAKLLYKPSTGELTSTAVAASNGIFVNSLTIGTSYTIPAGYSGMSAGTVTVSGGVTVTVPSGSRWVVV